ncbi:MAG: DinB family protein [Chitinophagaceae bacterium]|jgi:uncharacterized damage-inducible protein DinB|nr:DinB family protein [Chitinophagaceae bacterium]
MKKKNLGYTMLMLLVMTGFAGTVNLNPLTKKEKQVAVDHLKQSKDDLMQSVKGLSDNQLNFKPSAEEWSVNECIQHLALTENLFWESMNKALKETPNPDKRTEIKISDEEVLAKMASRDNKVKTFSTLTPDNSTFTTTKEALDVIKMKRKTFIQFIKTTETDMRSHVVNSPMGMVDAYHLVLMNAAHTNRHIQQINDVKSHTDFPKR